MRDKKGQTDNVSTDWDNLTHKIVESLPAQDRISRNPHSTKSAGYPNFAG